MKELDTAIVLADELCVKGPAADFNTFIGKINEITRQLSSIPTPGKEVVRRPSVLKDIPLTADGDFPMVSSTRFN